MGAMEQVAFAGLTAELFKAVTTSRVTGKWPANTSTLGQRRQNPHARREGRQDIRIDAKKYPHTANMADTLKSQPAKRPTADASPSWKRPTTGASPCWYSGSSVCGALRKWGGVEARVPGTEPATDGGLDMKAQTEPTWCRNTDRRGAVAAIRDPATSSGSVPPPSPGPTHDPRLLPDRVFFCRAAA